MKLKAFSVLSLFSNLLVLISGLSLGLSFYISFAATLDCDLPDQILIFTLIGFLAVLLAAFLNGKKLLENNKSFFSIALIILFLGFISMIYRVSLLNKITAQDCDLQELSMKSL